MGGTSASAPLWAGFAALVSQQAAAAGVSGPGFLNPALYAIGQGAGYAAAFHNITTGNNTNSKSPNKFFAVPGYDLCTGWGTPAGSNLIAALLAPGDALVISPGTGLAFEGPPAGPFHPSNQNCLLTNTGGSSLDWTVLNSAPWLLVTPPGGTLLAGGSATVLNLALSPMANLLAPGNYSSTLLFTNLGDGFGQSRTVVLTVDAAPQAAPGAALTTVYSFTGGNDGGFPNGLMPGNDGALYGTTRTGGSYSWGSLYRLPAGGPPDTLYSFTNGNDGATPFATLALGTDRGFLRHDDDGWRIRKRHAVSDVAWRRRVAVAGIQSHQRQPALCRADARGRFEFLWGLRSGRDGELWNRLPCHDQRRPERPAHLRGRKRRRPAAGESAAGRRREFLRHVVCGRRVQRWNRFSTVNQWHGDHAGFVQWHEWSTAAGRSGPGRRGGFLWRHRAGGRFLQRNDIRIDSGRRDDECLFVHRRQ